MSDVNRIPPRSLFTTFNLHERCAILLFRWIGGFVQLATLLCLSSLVVEGADPGALNEVKRPFRENASLPVDSNLLKQFGTVEDLLADQRWSEAIGILQDIAMTESKSLVLVEPGKVGGVATYSNVATRCNVLLSRISAKGRIAYREKADPHAKRWFENWRRMRDESELLRIVRQSFLSSYGDDALFELGEVAWQRGHFSEARSWWEQILPLPADEKTDHQPSTLRYPDSTIDPAAIHSRLILCSIMSNELFRAAAELRQFTTIFPTAAGWLAGRQGRYADILQQTLDDSKLWSQEELTGDVLTFGSSPERFRKIAESVDIGAFRWSQPLPQLTIPHQVDGLPLQIDPLSYHLVVHNGIVFANDWNAIRAWNILTGSPAWKSEGRDPAMIYPVVADNEPAVIAEKNCIGVPYYTMTIADDRLYARMGSPVTCASSSEMRVESPSELVCLSLAEEGKPVWTIAANHLVPDTASWRFEGSPIVVVDRVYVALCRRTPQLELMIACLDASDGQLIWKRPLGSFRNTVEDSNNRVSHLLLTAGGGRIFLSTDAGAIIAVDGKDGRLDWAVSYESRSDETLAALSDPSRKTLLPALFHAGLLFAAPNDANSAFCIEADTGQIRWLFPYVRNSLTEANDLGRRDRDSRLLRGRQWRHLLGVGTGGTSGRLIVSGASLWAIDINSGRVAWERSFGQRGNSAFGRGLITEEQILIPMRESIEVFNLKSGDPVRVVPLKTPDSAHQGGNLILASGMLLVAQPNQVSAYCEYSRMKNRIENELIFHSDDLGLQLQLVDLEASEGNLEAAVGRLQPLRDRIKPDDPAYFAVRKKLCNLLSDAGQRSFRASKFVEAYDYWLNAVSVVDDVAKRVDLIVNLSRAAEALERPDEAIAQMQEILNHRGLTTVRRENQMAGNLASREISRLIRERGRSVYDKIEAAAAAEFETLDKSANRAGLEKFVAKYPQSEIAVEARDVLVRLHLESGEFSEAFAVLNSIRRKAVDEQAYVNATMSMIEMLESVQAVQSAMRLWQSLGTRTPELVVMFRGKREHLGELVKMRLAHEDSRLRPTSGFVEPTWTRALESEGRIFVPEGEAPASKSAGMLCCSKHMELPNTWVWKCLDWDTGQIRWEEIATEPIEVVAWTPVHLLIGTAHTWHARSAENGRRIWEQTSLPVTRPLILKPSPNLGSDPAWPAFFDVVQGVQLFDPDNGRIVAVMKPQGRLQDIVGVGHTLVPFGQADESLLHRGGERIDALEATFLNRTSPPVSLFMQTMKPMRVWHGMAALSLDQASIAELSKGNEVWKQVPFMMGNRLISISKNQSLLGTRVYRAEPHQGEQPVKVPDSGDRSHSNDQWSFQNFSFGSADPFAFCSGDDVLLVAVDGSRLESFNVTTGARKWSTGIAELPLKDAARQIAVSQESLFVASQGVLRSIALHDGTVRWERYLGETAPQWRTLITSINAPSSSQSQAVQPGAEGPASLIAVWPVSPAQPNLASIRFCDAQTGVIVQQIRTDGVPQGVVLDRRGFGFFWTDKSVKGLKRAASQTVAETASNLGKNLP